MNSLLHKNNLASKPVMPYGKAKPIVQPKLAVNTPSDIYEQEADAMAERVMLMSSNETAKPVTGLIGKSLQRKCAHCEEEEKKKKLIMRKAGAGNSGMPVSSSFASSLNASKSEGSPLPQGTRSFMENAFSTDFSGVKIHTGSQASEMSKGINAKAFTYGNDIYFNSGEYSPNTLSGKSLLVHELTHTVQQGGKTAATIQRNTKQLSNAPNQSTDLLQALTNVQPDVSKQFSVRAVKEAEFQAMSGVNAASIPEKKLLSPADAGLTGTALGVLLGPRPTLPLPLGAKGIVWSANAHLSQFAIVAQENPGFAFFFGDLVMETYGFRANALLHIGSTVEKKFISGGWKITSQLNRGAGGNYMNDFIYPYMGSTAVYTNPGEKNIPGAEELAKCMLVSSEDNSLKGAYTLSTPPRDSPAFDRAFGVGKAEDLSFKPPEIVNCLNKANKIVSTALDGRDLVINVNGRSASIATATYLDTGEQVEGMLPGHAKNMKSYLKDFDANPATKGLSRSPISVGNWLNGLTGIIRIGGAVLLVYNVVKVGERYEQSSDFERPYVLGEEGAFFTAGLIGSLIGEALGETFFCAGTGPGFALCMLASGAIGGAVASEATHDTVEGIINDLKNAGEMNRKGMLAPNITDQATKIFGTEDQRRKYNQMKKIEKPEQNDGLLDLLHF
jgi:hypothetical protein